VGGVGEIGLSDKGAKNGSNVKASIAILKLSFTPSLVTAFDDKCQMGGGNLSLLPNPQPYYPENKKINCIYLILPYLK
jgi:hypothetical protein